MKKKLLIVIFCLALTTILVIAGVFLFWYSVRQVNWWAKPSVSPHSIGSKWVSEDGSLTFGTFEKFDSANYYTNGFLTVETEKIPIYITFGHEGSLWILLNDKPYVPNEEYEILEKWEALDYEETETEIVITLRVKETTCFTEGQKVKLIHKKTQ